MTKIKSLFSGASSQQISMAQKMTDFLTANGFCPENLDDMVYFVASNICNEVSTEDARADEFAAAYAINENSMTQQLTFIAAWAKDKETFRRHIEKEIKLNFSTVFE